MVRLNIAKRMFFMGQTVCRDLSHMGDEVDQVCFFPELKPCVVCIEAKQVHTFAVADGLIRGSLGKCGIVIQTHVSQLRRTLPSAIEDDTRF